MLEHLSNVHALYYVPYGSAGVMLLVAMVTEETRPLGVAVQLVERNDTPLGVQLVNPNTVGKSADPMDLVSLAQQVQKVRLLSRFTNEDFLTNQVYTYDLHTP